MYNDPINPERLPVPEQLSRRWGTVLSALQRVASNPSVQAALNTQQSNNAQVAVIEESKAPTQEQVNFTNQVDVQVAGEQSVKDMPAKSETAGTPNQNLLAEAYAKLRVINGGGND